MLMTYLILTGLFLVGALCGWMAVRFFRAERKILERMNLMLRSVHLCASHVQKVDKRLETIQEEERDAFDFHRRANERQRVMLASLNRQIENLETMVGDRHRADPKNHVPGTENNNHSLTAKGAQAQSTPHRNSAAGHVTLEEMFRAHGGRNIEEVVRNHRMKSKPHIAETPPVNLPIEPQMRRVVNG